MRISSSSSNRGVNINIDNIVIVLFSVLANVKAEIIKPWGEWMCNYCAMGNKIVIPTWNPENKEGLKDRLQVK